MVLCFHLLCFIGFLFCQIGSSCFPLDISAISDMKKTDFKIIYLFIWPIYFYGHFTWYSKDLDCLPFSFLNHTIALFIYYFVSLYSFTHHHSCRCHILLVTQFYSRATIIRNLGILLDWDWAWWHKREVSKFLMCCLKRVFSLKSIVSHWGSASWDLLRSFKAILTLVTCMEQMPWQPLAEATCQSLLRTERK